MPNSPEQYKLNFEGSETRKPERPKIEVHERDECGACGNFIEGPGSCFQCLSNTKKIKWKKEQGNQVPH